MVSTNLAIYGVIFQWAAFHFMVSEKTKLIKCMMIKCRLKSLVSINSTKICDNAFRFPLFLNV